MHYAVREFSNKKGSEPMPYLWIAFIIKLRFLMRLSSELETPVFANIKINSIKRMNHQFSQLKQHLFEVMT